MWNSVRAFFAIFDEAIRFAAAVDADPRDVTWSAGPANITVCIRPYPEGYAFARDIEDSAA
jgi:hypothetical protein